MTLQEFLALLVLWIIGPIISLIITAFLADRFVIRKFVRNTEVQDLIKLFREGKEYLKEILENQKKERKLTQ